MHPPIHPCQTNQARQTLQATGLCMWFSQDDEPRHRIQLKCYWVQCNTKSTIRAFWKEAQLTQAYFRRAHARIAHAYAHCCGHDQPAMDSCGRATAPTPYPAPIPAPDHSLSSWLNLNLQHQNPIKTTAATLSPLLPDTLTTTSDFPTGASAHGPMWMFGCSRSWPVRSSPWLPIVRVVTSA